jgi:hypothetical protein
MTIGVELEAQILRYYLPFRIMSSVSAELPHPSKYCRS